VNLDHAARQAADISNVFQSRREDHHREGARHLILTEGNALLSRPLLF
jgi:hypothetical protein